MYLIVVLIHCLETNEASLDCSGAPDGGFDSCIGRAFFLQVSGCLFSLYVFCGRSGGACNIKQFLCTLKCSSS